ncbi:MAG: hypothetical protein K2X47_16025 [Bdellovibrionales bacterium]|nr:hypothetical protein [Bdellovibrionales bacterium]
MALWQGPLGKIPARIPLPEFINIVRIRLEKTDKGYWTENSTYKNQAVLVRPDAYIESSTSVEEIPQIIQRCRAHQTPLTTENPIE